MIKSKPRLRSSCGSVHQVLDTHRRRSDFTDPCFLRNRPNLIDKREWICEFLPAGLEDRALRRRLKLVRPRLAHGPDSEGHGSLSRDTQLGSDTAIDIAPILPCLIPTYSNNQYQHRMAGSVKHTLRRLLLGSYHIRLKN